MHDFPLLKYFGCLSIDELTQQVLNEMYMSLSGTSDLVKDLIEILEMPNSIHELGNVDREIIETSNSLCQKN